jgi:hypothetical protein
MISMKIIQNAHKYNTRFEEPSVTHAENRKDNLDCYSSTHGIFFSQRQSWFEAKHRKRTIATGEKEKRDVFP